MSQQIKHSANRQGLRDKQVEALQALVSGKFTDEQIAHSYFKLPTGFGKTVMFANMARAYFDAIKAAGEKRQKIIIIVPRLSLIDQTKEKLNMFADIVATEYSGRKKDNNCDVIITTYNSLDKLFGSVDFSEVGLIFADEAHHMLGKKISEKLTFYNEFVPIIGFTATPEYEENRAVADMLNTEIFAMSIPDAVQCGVLSPVKNVLYRSSIVCDLSTVPAKSSGEYDYDKITKKISPETLATEIARIYSEGVDEDTGIEFKTLKAIINCPTAEIANLQTAKINEIIGRDVAVSLHKVGIKEKDFERLQKDFIAGKYTVACQVGTMTEGFDDVTVSMCINYPTRSRVKAEQTAGRAIRIDENDPNKVAFVVDTIFRSTSTESGEDILYTASNAHQVLFKDIAGSMVLYPKDFQKQQSQLDHPRQRKYTGVDFVDFELITDNAILIELNRSVQERMAKEVLPEKTEGWMSAVDLRKDPDFPSGSPKKINDALSELEHDPKFDGFIRPMRCGQIVAKCLHVSKKQAFAERAGFKTLPEKTDEWLSALDLKKDPDFPSAYPKRINEAFDELEHTTEFEGFIQKKKSSSGMIAKCLHISKKQAFAERVGFKALPKKTEEWLSAVDLRKDPDFPSGSDKNINKALKDLEYDPEFKGFIQDVKASGIPTKCLHISKKQAFADRAGFKALPEKTEEWLSAVDLKKDPDFTGRGYRKIIKALDDFEHDPEFKGFIKEMKAGGHFVKCLHISKRQGFANRIGSKSLPQKTPERLSAPQKTDEWLSAGDLIKDPDFPSRNTRNINKALKDLEHDPEFEGFIRIMRCGSKDAMCLYVGKKQVFAERAGFKSAPQKTYEWLSAETLMKDENFPSWSHSNIIDALNALEHDSDFEGFIKEMKAGGHLVKCLHISKKQMFAERAGFKAYPQKTDEWLSAKELARDKDFPSGKHPNIAKALQDLEHDPEFDGFIQDMKTSGMVTKCLHISKKQMFADRAGFRAVPQKTSEWLSTTDLMNDPTFPCGKHSKIVKALKDLEHDPEFDGFIQDMKTSGWITKCLHISKKQAFAVRAGFKLKTSKWLAVNDLSKDKDFSSIRLETINRILNELQHEPDWKEYVDMRTSANGKSVLCLYSDKLSTFKQICQQAETNSLRAATERATAVNTAHDIKDSIIPADQHEM